MKGEIKEIPIEQLEIDPMNIRGDLRVDVEMVESVERQGIIQMPIVRPRGRGRYGVVVGARRLTAAQNAGLKTLRCEVRSGLDDREAMGFFISENKFRKDIPEWKWAEIIPKYFKMFRGSKEERIRKIREKTGLSRRTIQRYLSFDRLSDGLKIMLKEPEERSKSDKEVLERVFGAPKMRSSASETEVQGKKAPVFDERSTEMFPLEKIISAKIPVEIAEQLERDRDFRKWEKKKPERALRVAIEAAERGRGHVPEVIKAEKEREKKKPVVRVPSAEFQGPPPPLRVQLGRPIMEALEKYVKDKNIISPEIAVKGIVRDFLTKEGYLR